MDIADIHDLNLNNIQVEQAKDPSFLSLNNDLYTIKIYSNNKKFLNYAHKFSDNSEFISYLKIKYDCDNVNNKKLKQAVNFLLKGTNTEINYKIDLYKNILQ